MPSFGDVGATAEEGWDQQASPKLVVLKGYKEGPLEGTLNLVPLYNPSNAPYFPMCLSTL